MEDFNIFEERMKKFFKVAKGKCTNILSRSKSASKNNLSESAGSLHAREQNQQGQSQQSDNVARQEVQEPVFVCVAKEERPEVSVVHCVPVGNCKAERKDLVPSKPVENNTCTSLVAVQDLDSENSSTDDCDTTANANTAVCLYEQPPAELVQLEDLPTDQLNVIRSEALQEANQEYPIKCYDFCLVCCEEDYILAENIKETLCRSFNLFGCMIENDTFMLGRDIFQAYEFMMDRSTKVMFLITDAFNRDPFNQRLQNGAVFQTLMSRVKKEKCVPIFPKGLREVPLPLSGIAGISCTVPPELLRARVNATYTEEVRRIRVMKEQVLLEMRDKFYNEVLARKAEEFKANLLQQQQKLALGASTRNNGNMMAITCGTDQPSQPGAPQGVKTIPELDRILTDAGLGAEQKNSVSNIMLGMTNPGPGAITVSGSEQVRIGNDVNIVVYVSSNGDTEVTTSDSQQLRKMSLTSESSQSSDSDTD